MTTLSKEEFIKYNHEVLDYLEYLGYPEYVIEFNPADIARSLCASNFLFYREGYSIRMAALICFGCTWESQIVGRFENETKH